VSAFRHFLRVRGVRQPWDTGPGYPISPIPRALPRPHDGAVSTFLLAHRHAAAECGAAFAAWKGFESPLRHRTTIGTCLAAGHELWWTVESEDERAALALLPLYVAERTTAVPVTWLLVP